MRYLPHTADDIAAMLTASGKKSLDELFDTVPSACRMQDDWALPPALNEWELDEHIDALAENMSIGPKHKVLIGAGSYHHFIPETVKALMSRSEFLTAYTPYQPEMAQGTLQGIFEYQTLTARLLGMDTVNASMYDGATALAEAVLMALRVGKKKTQVALSKAIHPHYRAVVQAYLRPSGIELIELDYLENGRTDLSALQQCDNLAAVALQSPNFFGIIEDLPTAAEHAHTKKALLISSFTEALAYGLLKNPGECGADIVCGEGQSFGLSRSFGGPGLGMFGCRNKFTRSMPGRLVGETKDVNGKRGYVLTLATREQHIRREKATSNICSNQGICAMTAAMYMASLGGTGLQELAKLNYDKAAYLKGLLLDCGASLSFSAPGFNEFVLHFKDDFSQIRNRLMEKNIVVGLELGHFYPELSNHYLFCVTETITKEDMDSIAAEVQA